MNFHPVTLQFSVLPYYEINPFLSVLKDPDRSIFDQKKSAKNFKRMLRELYQPLLEFMDQMEVGANTIISGDFITQVAEQNPKVLKLMRKLADKGLLIPIANAYYSNSLTSLYNSQWWAESIHRSQLTIEKHLGSSVRCVYVPQLFRGLELERVAWQPTGITHFLSRQKDSKSSKLKIALSELRRFNGSVVPWIEADKDETCHFIFVPDNQFFEVNQMTFEKDWQQASQALSMAIGLAYAKFHLKKPKAVQKPGTTRISERYSLVLYNSLERAVIRMWEYGSMLIATEHGSNPDKQSEILFQQFAALQNTEFLAYLRKSLYQNGTVDNFNSPHEAFVNMQTAIKQLEISLKNRI